MGVNVYGWRSSGVNHVLIFELDPRNHLSEQDLMELAAIFGVVWALSLLSFLYSSSLSIPPYINPLALVIIMVFFLINPLKVFRHDARFWFLRITVFETTSTNKHIYILKFIGADGVCTLFSRWLCWFLAGGSNEQSGGCFTRFSIFDLLLFH